MGDNPFSEPEDGDRTVIRPRPGGRRPAAPPAAAAAAPAPRAPSPVAPPPSEPPPRAAARPAPPPSAPRSAAPVVEPAAAVDIAELSGGGLSPMLAAAAPLLQLLARLRNTARAPDAGDLHARAATELQGFSERATAAEVPKEQLRTAHYALCASIDDVVLNTPWGAGGGWSTPLLSMFHAEVKGDRFFDLLTRIGGDPARFLPVLELMYLCVSLGYQGRFRGTQEGAEEIESRRAATHALIMAQRPALPATLSQQWEGVAAPYRPARKGVPVWVVGAAALAAMAALFVWTSTSLNAASDVVFDKMLHATPDHMPTLARAAAVAPPPPPPPSAEPDFLDTLRASLKPEIDKGQVEVLGTATTPIVRVRDRGMFAAGMATVQPPFRPVLERVGAVLKDEAGPITVVGYTDNQPTHTVKFASNFQLSTARAAAAKAVAARAPAEATRMTAEGRADADPIAPNTTQENRDANRRIEFVLHRPQ